MSARSRAVGIWQRQIHYQGRWPLKIPRFGAMLGKSVNDISTRWNSNIRCRVIALHRLVESNWWFSLKYSNLSWRIFEYLHHSSNPSQDLWKLVESNPGFGTRIFDLPFTAANKSARNRELLDLLSRLLKAFYQTHIFWIHRGRNKEIEKVIQSGTKREAFVRDIGNRRYLNPCK